MARALEPGQGGAYLPDRQPGRAADPVDAELRLDRVEDRAIHGMLNGRQRLARASLPYSEQIVDHVRGRGLLRGVVLRASAAKPVEAAARDAGFLVNAAAPDVIRLAPPLVITEAQIDDFLTALPSVLDKAAS